jgi:hypothetical protein
LQVRVFLDLRDSFSIRKTKLVLDDHRTDD